MGASKQTLSVVFPSFFNSFPNSSFLRPPPASGKPNSSHPTTHPEAQTATKAFNYGKREEPSGVCGRWKEAEAALSLPTPSKLRPHTESSRGPTPDHSHAGRTAIPGCFLSPSLRGERNHFGLVRKSSYCTNLSERNFFPCFWCPGKQYSFPSVSGVHILFREKGPIS